METTEMRLSQADIRQIARLVTENLLYRLNDTGMIYDPITIEEAVALTGLSKQTFYNNMNSFHHATKGKLTILCEPKYFASQRINHPATNINNSKKSECHEKVFTTQKNVHLCRVRHTADFCQVRTYRTSWMVPGHCSQTGCCCACRKNRLLAKQI